LGRARRGASGALHPQSAIAELNSRPRPPVRRAGGGPGRCRRPGPAQSRLVNPVRTGR